MNETIIYELKELMKNAKPALEIADYYSELPTFTEELNQQADARGMSIQYLLMPLAEITSNYIISGEAKKCQEYVAEFAARVMQIIDSLDMYIDVQLTNPAEMTFSIFFYKDEHIVVEITA